MHLRDIFFKNLYYEFKRGNKNKFIIVTNDFGAPFLDTVKKDFPNYYLNAGICEQNIVTLSAGLAKEGFYPIIYSISSFILYRSFEQIKLDLSVHAGHGLTYESTKKISKIKEISEFNIGHFIISESIFYGLKNTIKKFKKIIN